MPGSRNLEKSGDVTLGLHSMSAADEFGVGITGISDPVRCEKFVSNWNNPPRLRRSLALFTWKGESKHVMG